MTKAGFKSVTIPDSLYWVLSTTAKINKISIGKVIEQGVMGDSPMADNREVLRSNRSGPMLISEKQNENSLDAISVTAKE